MMGFSMISPTWPVIFFWGLAISPRIPASCRICSLEPRAPESAIMKTGLNPLRSVDIPRNITSETSDVVWVQTSMIML
jgi:hypothetical protein